MLRSIVLFVLIVFSVRALADDLTGDARIVDGDTIWIGPMKIRLDHVSKAFRFSSK